jgi:S-adenosylmethionine hydrolase
MKKLIVIADWASDTLTCQEFRSVVEGFIQKSDHGHIYFVSSSPSTIHTSFILSQTVETEEHYGKPQETIFFINTDFREKGKGADFLVIKLISGIYICGPNAGYVFSMIKKKIDVAFIYNQLSNEAQFRSRDLYSHVCAHLMDEIEDELELDEIHTNIIPELRGFYVIHIDNFGNIKTTITLEDLKGKYEFGDEFFITINNICKKVRLVPGLFKAEPGVLIIYPGSSGKKDNPYLEVSIWRHFTEKDISTGRDVFGNPRPGMSVEIK